MSWRRELKRLNGVSASMELKSVSAGVFEQYRIKPEAGRLFTAAGDKEDDPVPVITVTFGSVLAGALRPRHSCGMPSSSP